MSKFKTINGWTKEKMKAQIRAKNTGVPSILRKSNDYPTDKNQLFQEICAYRGIGGNCCAAGCFIPDEEYSPKLEGKSVIVLSATGLDFKWPLSREGMAEMQTVHDGYKGETDMRDVLCDWIDHRVED